MQRKLNKALNHNKRKLKTINPIWSGSTWDLDVNGRAYNTPTLGAELLTNTEFTSNTLGWGAINTATLTKRDFASSPNIAPTGGTDNLGLEIASGGNANSAAQANPTLITGTWYQLAVRAYSPATNAPLNAALLTANQPPISARATVSENAWQSLVSIARATSTAGDIRLRCNSSTSGNLVYFDAPSLKAFSLPTIIATIAGTTPNQIAASKIHTLTTGTQTGVVSLLDSSSSPANFLIAYHDGTNIKLDKCVAGVYTNLISAAIAFSSNTQLEIRRPSGNIFQVWYAGSQRGTDQIVNDSGIINNAVYGLFSTYSGNLFSEFSLGGLVVPFSF